MTWRQFVRSLEADARRRERARQRAVREAATQHREYEREQARLEKEKAQKELALDAVRRRGDGEAVAELEQKIAEIQGAIDGVVERAANVRAGYVYIISNIGSFGERVVKIGLTRRLDAMDRVRELGDASVPFRFDAHAIIFSEDAVGLEAELHRRFSERRVNLLSFVETAEAVEWRQSSPSRLDR